MKTFVIYLKGKTDPLRIKGTGLGAGDAAMTVFGGDAGGGKAPIAVIPYDALAYACDEESLIETRGPLGGKK